jgi:hypothetical protein
MEFLSAVPTEWDETKVSDEKIADYVLIAGEMAALVCRSWGIGRARSQR